MNKIGHSPPRYSQRHNYFVLRCEQKHSVRRKRAQSLAVHTQIPVPIARLHLPLPPMLLESALRPYLQDFGRGVQLWRGSIDRWLSSLNLDTLLSNAQCYRQESWFAILSFLGNRKRVAACPSWKLTNFYQKFVVTAFRL